MTERMTERTVARDPEEYMRDRLRDLSVRLIEIAVDASSDKAVEERRQFEEHVDRRLRNGAKFVPRKRQPS